MKRIRLLRRRLAWVPVLLAREWPKPIARRRIFPFLVILILLITLLVAIVLFLRHLGDQSPAAGTGRHRHLVGNFD